MTTYARAFPDHSPSCPQCGNLCGRLARICADCGAFLYEPNLNDRIIRERLHGKTWPHAGRDDAGRFEQAATDGEATTPTKGTVN